MPNTKQSNKKEDKRKADLVEWERTKYYKRVPSKISGGKKNKNGDKDKD